jgi:hypothetical protein
MMKPWEDSESNLRRGNSLIDHMVGGLLIAIRHHGPQADAQVIIIYNHSHYPGLLQNGAKMKGGFFVTSLKPVGINWCRLSWTA